MSGSIDWQFESWAAFWQMAGHGPYVWAAVAVTAVVMVALLVAPLRRQRRLLTEVRAEQARAARRAAVSSPTNNLS